MRRAFILAGAMCAALSIGATAVNAATTLPPGDPTVHAKDPDGNKITINYGDVNNVVISIDAVINGVSISFVNVHTDLPDNTKITFFPDHSFTLTPGIVTIGQPVVFRLKIGDNGREVIEFPTGAQNSLTLVPEPATWAMMLMGLLGLGGVMRARRRPAALIA